MNKRQFTDRKEAGQLLAKELSAYSKKNDWIVIALPRGGVVVGFEVAKALSLHLTSFVQEKSGRPAIQSMLSAP